MTVASSLIDPNIILLESRNVRQPASYYEADSLTGARRECDLPLRDA